MTPSENFGQRPLLVDSRRPADTDFHAPLFLEGVAQHAKE
jgi:hypothetical protein